MGYSLRGHLKSVGPVAHEFGSSVVMCDRPLRWIWRLSPDAMLPMHQIPQIPQMPVYLAAPAFCKEDTGNPWEPRETRHHFVIGTERISQQGVTSGVEWESLLNRNAGISIAAINLAGQDWDSGTESTAEELHEAGFYSGL